jgi:hypothetical protein
MAAHLQRGRWLVVSGLKSSLRKLARKPIKYRDHSHRERGIYSALRDAAYFAQARIELGVVTWPNGADLDPDWMHDELKKAETWSVPEISPEYLFV